MADSKSKTWLNLGAAALALIIIAAIVWVKTSGEKQPAVKDIPELAELPVKIVESTEPEPPPAQDTQAVQEHRERMQLQEKQLSPEQLGAMRREYNQLAMEQRRRLEKEYLDVARQLFEKNPIYVSALERKDDWPFEKFGTDFRDFETSRKKYLEVLPGKAVDIGALLSDIEATLVHLLPVAIEASPEYLEKEKGLMEKFTQLDKALDEFNPENW